MNLQRADRVCREAVKKAESFVDEVALAPEVKQLIKAGFGASAREAWQKRQQRGTQQGKVRSMLRGQQVLKTNGRYRNKPCPCGSRLKFKKCCLSFVLAESRRHRTVAKGNFIDD